MTVASIIYLLVLLLFLIGAFIFFVVMDLTKHKTKKPKSTKAKK